MTRYARKLSAVGFALAAWYVYVLGSVGWQSWDGHGFGEFPGLPLAFFLGAIALPSGGCGFAAPDSGPRPCKFLCTLAGPALVGLRPLRG